MIENYLAGSIGQSLERIRQLRQIVQGQYRREYDGLRQVCLMRLDNAQAELGRLAKETVVDIALQTPRRIREFKRIVQQINVVEGVGAFALSRVGPDDDFLNRLITDICSEIRYPLIPPVISQMSQDYFHIYSDFNLLCLPLIESRFLLHLPDIYHELCHPFHRMQNSNLPALEPYHAAYKASLFAMVAHFRDEIVSAERVRKPTGKHYQLELWRTSWVKYWMEELFCDLFGVLTTGPAFVWSHYHLCVERGGDPFDTPMMSMSTHPADDARMRAALAMLNESGFKEDAELIKAAWRDFIDVMEYTPPPEYRQCYPDALLSVIVSKIKEGVQEIGTATTCPGAQAPVVALLNAAWQEFWKAPKSYQTWEAAQLGALWKSAIAPSDNERKSTNFLGG